MSVGQAGSLVHNYAIEAKCMSTRPSKRCNGSGGVVGELFAFVLQWPSTLWQLSWVALWASRSQA